MKKYYKAMQFFSLVIALLFLSNVSLCMMEEISEKEYNHEPHYYTHKDRYEGKKGFGVRKEELKKRLKEGKRELGRKYFRTHYDELKRKAFFAPFIIVLLKRHYGSRSELLEIYNRILSMESTSLSAENVREIQHLFEEYKRILDTVSEEDTQEVKRLLKGDVFGLRDEENRKRLGVWVDY